MTNKLNFDQGCITSNGARTVFTLRRNDEQNRVLCREDLHRISEGDFEFCDGREPIDANEEERKVIIESALTHISYINQEVFIWDFFDPQNNHFVQNAERFHPIELIDLGSYFIHCNEPHVFRGSRPKARKFKFAATNLKTGIDAYFEQSLMESLLNKQ